jgi:hypothetical protein
MSGERQPYGGGYTPGTGTRFTINTAGVTPGGGPTGSWTWTVPPGGRCKVLSVYANPVAGAVVANREPNLQLRNPANEHVLSLEGGPLITASTEKELFWIAGLGGITANGAASFMRSFPLFDFILDVGYILRMEVFGGQAGDSIGEARIFGENFT